MGWVQMLRRIAPEIRANRGYGRAVLSVLRQPRAVGSNRDKSEVVRNQNSTRFRGDCDYVGVGKTDMYSAQTTEAARPARPFKPARYHRAGPEARPNIAVAHLNDASG